MDIYQLNIMYVFVVLVKSLCGLEASCVPTDEVLSVAESCDSSDEMESKDFTNDRILSRKKKSKRHKGKNSDQFNHCMQGVLLR